MEVTPIRKSMSLTMLEKPLPEAPLDADEMGFRKASNDETVTISNSIRTPGSERSSLSGSRSIPWENSTEDVTSTVPPTADLSTIIEADTSGISKHLPSTTNSSPSPPSSRFPSHSSANSPIVSSNRARFQRSATSSPSDSPLMPVQQLRPVNSSRSNSIPSPSPSPFSPLSSDADIDGNDSSHLELDLSTSQINSQVASAMNNAGVSEWLKDANARVVDVDDSLDIDAVLDDEPQQDEEPNAQGKGNRQHTGSLIINMDTVDPQLAALLSPHRIPAGRVPSVGSDENDTIVIPKSIFATNSSLSQTPGSSSSSTILPKSRLPQQQSSLPRLRPRVITPSNSGSSAAESLRPSPPSRSPPVFQTDVFVMGQAQGRDGTSIAGSSQTLNDVPPASASSSQTRLPPSPGITIATSSSPASGSPTATAFTGHTTPSTSTAKPSPSIASSSSMTRSYRSASGRGHSRMLTSPVNITPDRAIALDPAFVPRPSSSSGQRKANVDSSSKRQHRPHLGIGLGLPSTATPSPPLASPVLPRGSFDSSPRRQLVNEHGEILGRGSLDESFSPRRQGTSTPSSAFAMKRQRKRSMSVEDTRLSLSVGRSQGDGSTGTRERAGSALSTATSRAYAYLGRKHEGSVVSDRERPGSSASGRPPVTEWLGPRTAKAFRAAGLLDGKELPLSASPDPGSISGHLQVRRYGSLRSTSGYNRANSRAAFSEAGGSGSIASSGKRRGSGSYFSSSNGGGGSVQSPTSLMDSPTFTTNSRDRETPPRSASTAPTSVSGYSNRERDDEVASMKEKHAVETSALLSALSDSQRTARVLRDENTELRERLEVVGRVAEENQRLLVENEQLREGLRELEEDNQRLRRVVGELKVQMRLNEMRAGASVPERRLGYGSLGRHAGSPLRPRAETPPSPSPPPTATKDSFDFDAEFDRQEDVEDEEDSYRPASTISRDRRSSSASSSVFPAPPPEMTMLLQEDHQLSDHSMTGYASSYEPGSPTIAIPLSKRISGVNGHRRNASITSISPTTANFSMMSGGTGSPGSLCLRPEHEQHLGDMDSLDLGHRSDEMENEDW
ncbi:hypothetical protein VNI00_012565 [Paramarasmius palmivorus]|uniref:Uncharacterized protein n=1 Tax=Paramarasmius palmivorus TaxID=297713 RepID=A0AAW0C4L0_9AGAR